MTHAETADALPRPGPRAWRAARERARPAFGMAVLLSAAVNVLMLTGSIYMLQVYDRVLTSGSVPTLVSLFLIVVLLYGFLGLFDGLRARLLSRAAHRLDADLGPAACAGWLEGRRGASAEDAAQGQALSDLDTVRGFVASTAMRGLLDMPFVPLFVGVLFVIHPWLGWLTLAGAGIAALLALAGRLTTAAALGRGQQRSAEARAFADGARQAAETTAAMGMRPALIHRWSEMRAEALADAQAGGERADGISAFSKAFRMLLQSAILTLGAWLVIGGQMSAGAIIAASILSGRALGPIDQAIGQWKAITGAQTAWSRLGATFREGTDAPRAPTELPAPKGAIEVSRLTVLAPGRQDWRLLTQIDFRLEPGDGLGVIGSSASGKSTLARCLVGAWAADMGEVRFDGAAIGQWSPEALGRHVGYLPQSALLLPGTVRDNIARMEAATPDAAVIDAARLAGIHDMILALPQGYDTPIGPGAPPLSGGQVQRIGLARALCGRPRIVVLDEPNANLDAEGDAALSRAISAMREAGSTVIVMAHRPSAIAAVNKVLVMQGGIVSRFGPKEEVLAAALDDGPAGAAAARTAKGATLRALPRRGDAAALRSAPVKRTAAAPGQGAVAKPKPAVEQVPERPPAGRRTAAGRSSEGPVQQRTVRSSSAAAAVAQAPAAQTAPLILRTPVANAAPAPAPQPEPAPAPGMPSRAILARRAAQLRGEGRRAAP